MATGFARGDWARGWRSNNTPWVSAASDDLLESFLPRLRRLLPTGRAFIPLCGNSRSVRRLYDEGYEVAGIEYVPKAIRSLIGNHFPRHRFRARRDPPGRVHTARRIVLYEHDLFTFQERECFDFIYDRASLIAIAPGSRRRYAAILARALKPGGLMMIVAFTAAGGRISGPPFPITEAEIRRLFPAFTLVTRRVRRVKWLEERFTRQGVTDIRETMVVLKKGADWQGLKTR